MTGKPGKTTNLWLVLWLIAPLLLYLATASCAAGQTIMSRQSVPIAIDIDGTLQRSGLYFQFEARWYNMPLDQFTAARHDAAETACAATLNAIRTRNYTAFKNSWEIPSIPSAPG